MSTAETASILKTETPFPGASGCPFHQAVRPAASAPPPESAAIKVSTFVALSKFVIANDKMVEMKEAFRRRPHLVDDQPGFVRMDVFSPLDKAEEIWLVNRLTEQSIAE